MSGHLKIVRRPKSPFWYIRGSVRRIRVEESTGIVDDGRVVSKKIAEEIRANREAEIIERSIRAKAGKPRTLQDRVASKFASFLKRNIEPAGYLYRHFHPSGDLIYVGITQSLSKRTNAHLSKATWKDFICLIVIEPFKTREEALEAELVAIRTEFPKYNRIFNGHRHPIQELTRRQADEQRRQKVARRAAAEVAATTTTADTTPSSFGVSERVIAKPIQ
jgi:predicted GIY-YIG superfamily endonuclease